MSEPVDSLELKLTTEAQSVLSEITKVSSALSGLSKSIDQISKQTINIKFNISADGEKQVDRLQKYIDSTTKAAAKELSSMFNVSKTDAKEISSMIAQIGNDFAANPSESYVKPMSQIAEKLAESSRETSMLDSEMENFYQTVLATSKIKIDPVNVDSQSGFWDTLSETPLDTLMSEWQNQYKGLFSSLGDNYNLGNQQDQLLALRDVLKEIYQEKNNIGKSSNAEFIKSSAISETIKEIDKLMVSIENAKEVLNRTGGTTNASGTGFTELAKGIEKLSTADTENLLQIGTVLSSVSNGIQNLNGISINVEPIVNLAATLKKLCNGNINYENINNIANSVSVFVNSFTNLSGMSEQISQITSLANAIKQLGYKSAKEAIGNIPQIATALNSLMTTLSNAPEVSSNLIDMTNALAQLANVKTSGITAAAKSISNLNTETSKTSGSAMKATSGVHKLSSALARVQVIMGTVQRASSYISSWIDTASDLVEVQNVVSATFADMSDKVDEFASTSIQQFGMSELTAKKTASTFQAMGNAMGISASSIASANEYLSTATSGYVGLSDSMSDVSLNLTKLTADMASFYNMEQSDVAEDLEAIFTGQTVPLRQYGLDLTQATLSEWALKNGLDADIDSMTQAEKTMLRYQYVLANTTDAQNDFSRTSNTWANQTRILKQQIEQLEIIIGNDFINALKPAVSALNTVIAKIQTFAETVSDSLGVIFGWKYEISEKGATSYADSIDDVSDSIDGAADSAKSLNKQLANFDELNNLTTNDDSDSGSGSSTSSSLSGSSSTTTGQWVETEKIYESTLDDLYKLGDYIGTTFANTLRGIDWDSVYQGAKDFGSGLAEFLNGLISPNLFGAVGRTIAASLNTALYSVLSFGETFDWTDLGDSIAAGINEFFETYDYKALGKTLNAWVHGLVNALYHAITGITWSDVLKAGLDFLTNLDLGTVIVTIAAWKFKHGGAELAASIRSGLSKALASMGGISGLLKMDLGTILGAGTATEIGLALGSYVIGGIISAFVGWNFGQFLYEKITGETIDMSFGEQMAYLWDSILSGEFLPALGATISDIVGAIFNWDETFDLFAMAGEAFSGVVEAFKEHDWAGIATNILDGIALGFTGILDFFLEPINDLFKTICDGICSVFGIHSPAEAMKPYGENIFKGIVEGFTSLFSTINDIIGRFFDIMGTAITGAWETVKTWGTNLIGKFTSGISDGIQSVKDTASAVIGAIEGIFDVPDTFTTWAKDMMDGFIGGIKSGIDGVGDAVSSVADKISSFLHFSVPDEGPLTEYESWMPDFLKGLASGIADSSYLVENEINKLAGNMNLQGELSLATVNTDNIDKAIGLGAVASSSANYKIDSNYNYDNSQEISLFQTAISLLEEIANKEYGITDADIAKSIKKSSSEYYKRTGQSLIRTT